MTAIRDFLATVMAGTGFVMLLLWLAGFSGEVI